MFSKSEVQGLIDDLLEEYALTVGGLIVVHNVDDEVVGGLFLSLRDIRHQLLKRLDAESAIRRKSGRRKPTKPKPHPVIQAFLAGLGGGEH